MFYYILIMNLLHIEDYFRGVVLLNPKVNVVLIVSSLSEFLVRHNIGVKTRDISNVFELE